jgi:hypothetical protein
MGYFSAFKWERRVDDGTTVACQWYAFLDTDAVTHLSVSYQLSFLVLRWTMKCLVSKYLFVHPCLSSNKFWTTLVRTHYSMQKVFLVFFHNVWFRLNIKLLSEDNIKQMIGRICTVHIPEQTLFICLMLSSENTVWYSRSNITLPKLN